MNEEIFMDIVLYILIIIIGFGTILVSCVGFYRLLEALSEMRKKRNAGIHYITQNVSFEEDKEKEIKENISKNIKKRR